MFDPDLLPQLIAAAYVRLWRDDGATIVKLCTHTWIVNDWLVVDCDRGTWTVHVHLPPGHPAWGLACIESLNRQRVKVEGPTGAVIQILRHEAHLRAHQTVGELVKDYGTAAIDRMVVAV